MRELTRHRADCTVHISAVRRRIEGLESLLEADREDAGQVRDAGWDAEALREEYGRGR
ncbi:MAG TPA: hypothetical protein VHN15_04370 [Thermoanaerobaculia bacterium]|nr:hypothetical protein [Thermoanaerobaculia bacterium]